MTIANNQIPRIVTVAIIIIVVLLGYLWITAIFPKGPTTIENVSANISSEFIDANISLDKLPPEIHGEIRNLERKYSFTLEKWEYNPEKNTEINLYAHDFRNQSVITDLQGKKMGNYTIQIIHDIEFESIRADVEQQLVELKKNPDYQISWIGMVTDTNIDPPENKVEVWVEKLTPENKKLDNTIIKGWKIHVYPMSPPPTTQRSQISSLHTTL